MKYKYDNTYPQLILPHSHPPITTFFSDNYNLASIKLKATAAEIALRKVRVQQEYLGLGHFVPTGCGSVEVIAYPHTTKHIFELKPFAVPDLTTTV